MVPAAPAPVRGQKSEVKSQGWSQQAREKEGLGMEEQSEVCVMPESRRRLPQRLTPQRRGGRRGDREGPVREEETAVR